MKNQIFLNVTRVSVFFTLLFFYSCSFTNDYANSLKPQSNQSLNSFKVGDVIYEITSEPNQDVEIGKELTPTCSCEGMFCSSKSYCMNGKSCSCTCGWVSCSCTGCSSGRIAINFNEPMRSNRIALENYLYSKNNTKLSEMADILVSVRKSLEEKDAQSYLSNTETAKKFAKTLSVEENDGIQKWINERSTI